MRPAPSSLVSRRSRAPCPPVDRCWGVPMLGALATLMVCLPASYMGLLFVFFVEDYGLNRAEASWPQNVLIVGSQLSGLVVGVLQQRFCVAEIAVMSSILASVALAASAFSRHVVWMSITLGATYGLGMGMFLTCVCVYSMMLFDRYKGTAVSLIFTAWSVSGIYAPAILSCLHKVYALQGALLICGGLVLHAVPLTMLLKNPLLLSSDCLKDVLGRLSMRSFTKAEEQFVKPRQLAVTDGSSAEHISRTDEIMGLTIRTPSGSITAVEPYRICFEHVDFCSSRGSFQEPNLSSAANARQPSSVLETSVLLLGAPAFYVFLLATVVGEYSVTAFAMTIVDYAMDKGVELDVAALLLTFGAVGQILGRLFLMPLSDWVPSARHPLFAASFAIEAVCTLAMPHVFSVHSIVALRIVETMMQGFAASLRGILLVHYIGIGTIATCTGLFGLALIPLSLSSASMIGFFRDSIGSYDGFYRMLAAVNAAVAIGLCVFFIADWKCSWRRENACGDNNRKSERLLDAKNHRVTQA